MLPQAHPIGKTNVVDYAGQTISVIDPRTQEIQAAPLFVAAIGLRAPPDPPARRSSRARLADLVDSAPQLGATTLIVSGTGRGTSSRAISSDGRTGLSPWRKHDAARRGSMR